MGLLDVFNSDEGRMALGLLAAAGPSSQPMSFGQRLAGAMSQHDAYLQHKQAAAAAAQDRALKQQMLQAQMADVRAQQQQREVAAADVEAREQEIRTRGRLRDVDDLMDVACIDVRTAEQHRALRQGAARLVHGNGC